MELKSERSADLKLILVEIEKAQQKSIERESVMEISGLLEEGAIWLEHHGKDLDIETNLKVYDFLANAVRKMKSFSQGLHLLLSFFFYNNKAYFIQKMKSTQPEIQKYLKLSLSCLKAIRNELTQKKEESVMENIKYLFTMVKLQLQLIDQQKTVPDFDTSMRTNKRCLENFSLLINTIFNQF